MCPIGLEARPIALRVASPSGELLTAEAGRELGQEVRAAVAASAPGKTVVLDLRQCRHAGYRALHEVFGAVATAHADNAARYLVVHIEQGADELRAALNAAAIELHAPLPVVIGDDDRVHVLGRLTKSEAHTLELVQRMGSVTAGALRARAPLGASAASNRLRRLYRLRLVCREERIIAHSGGREFLYEPLAINPIPVAVHAP